VLFEVDRLIVDRVCTQSQTASLTTLCTILSSTRVSRWQAELPWTLIGTVANRYSNSCFL